jgi:two-component system, NarL family, nitrate/nitrite response regulator NarL
VTAAPRTTTVIIVARDAMLAARVEAAVRTQPGWCVEMASLARARQRIRERPDALAVVAPGAIELRRTVRALAAEARRPSIVALVEEPARHWTASLRALGLRAVLSSRATSDEIAAALRAVQTGLLVIPADALAPRAPVEARPVASRALTGREREILELMAEGASNRRIAVRLAISRHTAKFHVASILAKLGARSRTEAVTLALRAGLLEV